MKLVSLDLDSRVLKEEGVRVEEQKSMPVKDEEGKVRLRLVQAAIKELVRELSFFSRPSLNDWLILLDPWNKIGA